MGTLSRHDDKELIAELKARGYMVIKADAVRTVGVSETILKQDLLFRDRGYAEHVKSGLGVALGRFLSENPEFPIRELPRDPATVEYRVNLTFLSAPVSVDDPEYPMYLSKALAGRGQR